MSAASSDPTFLIRRLIDLAEQERDALDAEAWDDAVAIRAAYDECFSQLEKCMGDAQLPRSSRNDLVRLDHLHAGNLRRASEAKARLGDALVELNKVTRIGGYAPLGPENHRGPRYLDHSA